MTIKDDVFEVMSQAYAEASGNGSFPAEARSMMYAARRLSGLGDELKSDYFLKGANETGLLDQYLNTHPETADWDVVRDARGTFREPHTGNEVPLGTIAVRDHISDWNDEDDQFAPGSAPRFSLDVLTVGPLNRYGAVLYIEKEGLLGAVYAAGIVERYDLAIASCKGVSVRAARRLLRELADTHDVRVLVAHDFDKAGFVINGTLDEDDTDDFIDLGLRLTDIEDERWGLAEASMSERVTYGKSNPRSNLEQHWATEEEIEFLCPAEQPVAGVWEGRRVELNALVGETFTNWLEAKLVENGIEKVVPEWESLDRAFERARRLHLVNQATAKAWNAIEAANVEVPEDLLTLVTDALDEDPTRSWDEVVGDLARETA